MSDFRDSFEHRLIEAGRRFHAEPSPAKRRRWGIKRTPVLALGVLAIAGSALAAMQPWSPTLGDPDIPGERPAISASAPPDNQRELVGVLRRDPAPADRDADTRAALRYLSTRSDGVRTDYIRKLHGQATSATLVPARSWSPAPGEFVIRDPLCVVVSDTQGAAKNCWSTDDVRAGRAYGQLGTRLYGLVPDGVEAVRISFDSDDLTAPVSDNFFAIQGRRDPFDPELTGQRPTAIIWLGEDGEPIPFG